MGRKKTVMKIPTSATLICPACKKATRAIVSIENSPQKYSCPKCKTEIKTPLTSCCVICAYNKTGKTCPRTMYMKARVAGLEIK
jgi:hypothetical protein